MSVSFHGIPLLIISHRQELSVAMWVQFETRGETGTYFTLYSVDHPDKAINKRVLMQAVNLGVFVNLFGPEVPSVFLQVSVAQPLHYKQVKSQCTIHHAIHYELVHNHT